MPSKHEGVEDLELLVEVWSVRDKELLLESGIVADVELVFSDDLVDLEDADARVTTSRFSVSPQSHVVPVSLRQYSSYDCFLYVLIAERGAFRAAPSPVSTCTTIVARES